MAIDRVKDPSIIPQDKPWTIEIYKALADEFRSLNEFHNAIDIYKDILKKWPMDPTAPEVQNSVAETYDQLNATVHSGTAEHDENAAKALEARTLLANYIGTTPWTDANKENPAALQNAERLVRGGLRQAAAQHTNNGKAQLVAAGETADAKAKIEYLSRSVAEYKLAAMGWEGYWKQDENAPDAYESRFWLADARHNQVRIQLLLHKAQRSRFPEPSTEEVESAKVAAVAVRDSDEDDKYLEPAGLFVVDESDVGRDLEYQRWDDTRGVSGIEPRAQVKFDSMDPETRKVVVDPIPQQVQASMAAREEYVQRVPANLDVNHRALDYQWYTAEVLFTYGHFDEAKARYEPMYKDHCGKDDYGYRAWEKLISMSNFTHDAERSRQLAEAEKNHSCAVNEEQKSAADLIVKPTIQLAYYQDASKVFKAAEEGSPGPARDALWRKAAGMYEAALLAAPARDEAPEAAINGAYAYKQVGEFGKAIGMYDKFITEYGNDERLTILQNGDAKNRPDPEEVPGPAAVPRPGVRRPQHDLLRLLQLPAGRGHLREDRGQRPLRRDQAQGGGAQRDAPLRQHGAAREGDEQLPHARQPASDGRREGQRGLPRRRLRPQAVERQRTRHGVEPRGAPGGRVGAAELLRHQPEQHRCVQVLSAGSVLGLQDEEDGERPELSRRGDDGRRRLGELPGSRSEQGRQE